VTGGTIEEQTAQTLRNIETILQASGLTLDHIVKINSYLSRPEDVPGYNEVYKKLLNEPFPTRTTITCGIGIYLIEMDAVAYVPAIRSTTLSNRG
jgi:2-iminobutanoate/2-iminopropanoate deaminase